MSDLPNVSVIIPTFDRMWCLPAAVASCRGTRCRTEIIVVDDGSTDGTWDWLRTQPDIIAIYQANRGKDWAVARALSVARGAFVKFLDSDDEIVQGTIDAQWQLACDSAPDLVVAGMELVDTTGAVTERHEYAVTDDFIAQQLGEGHGSHYSAFLFHRTFIDGIPHRQEYGALDDRMFILEVALRNPRIAVSPGCALRHLSHANARLQSGRGIEATVRNHCLLRVYERILGDLRAEGKLTPRRAHAACNALWPLAHAIARTHPHDAYEVVEWIRRLDANFRGPEGGVLGGAYAVLGFRATETLLRIRRGLVSLLRRPSPQPLHRFPA